MRCFLIGFSGFFVAMIVTLFVWASYSDYSARATLSETIAEITPLREKITETINRQRAVANSGAALTQAATKQAVPLADYLMVTPDGTIVFRSTKHGQMIVFEPFFRAGEVTWKCIGSKPDKNIPRDCQ